ncbi:unnamed protein product [Lepeophtheirus salmonis]|uniref:(salmon louse) hypothetical protein n=1 Tax=Lepeophtheirus salmonis TaxID=72036 RepID=A0A7R8H4V2_LEPSM|nr:unnamed protein product [Lepeophtheirus salmonis]CAF2854486.1 unnamed protein product [Lepeophtheirus salmonis]
MSPSTSEKKFYEQLSLEYQSLRCSSFIPSHNALNIKAFTERFSDGLKLGDKIVAISIDNANNVVAAVTGFKLKKVQSIECFAHSLNLMIEYTFLQVPAVSTLKNEVSDIFTTTRMPSIVRRSTEKVNVKPKRLISGVSVQQLETSSLKSAVWASFRRAESPSDRRVSNVNMEMQSFPSKWLDPEQNIVNWWSVNAQKYKYSFHLMLKYFSDQAPIVPSKSLFSSTGYGLNKRGSRFSEENAEILVALHYNLKIPLHKNPDELSN